MILDWIPNLKVSISSTRMKIFKKLNLGKKHLRGKNKTLHKNCLGNTIMIICVYLRAGLCCDDSFSFACLWLCIRLLRLSRLSRAATLGLHGSSSMLLLLGGLDVDVESDVTSLLQSDTEQRKY